MKALPFTYDLQQTGGLPTITLPEGNLKGFCFLIDTGSNTSILFNGCVEEHINKLTLYEEKGSIWGLAGISVETSYVSADVTFCEKEANLIFQVVDDEASNSLFEQTGVRIHGIIGTNFMCLYNMLIDMVNQRVLVAPPEYKKGK